ncbi:MAG TPA: hypothetical protein VGE29_17700 [Prosthecobacter sp.]
MAAPLPKKKSAIDTLVAKDQTAVFWFIVACLVAGGCAWYLVVMSEELRARPPFVVMDGTGSYYISPGLNYNKMLPMHLNLTEAAVECIFDRGPNGLTRAEQMPFYCNKIGYNVIRRMLEKEARYFQTQKVHQTVEIHDRKLMGTNNTMAVTNASGLVYRRSTFNGKEQLETYRFYVQFVWRLNPDLRRNKAFPSVIEDLQKYELEKISDS